MRYFQARAPNSDTAVRNELATERPVQVLHADIIWHDPAIEMPAARCRVSC